MIVFIGATSAVAANPFVDNGVVVLCSRTFAEYFMVIAKAGIIRLFSRPGTAPTS